MHPFFGAVLPTGWVGELDGLGDPPDQWQTVVDYALTAEARGFDMVWAPDHFHTAPNRPPSAVLDSWAVLAGISQRTSRIRLGHMVECAAHRTPGVVAKAGATLDAMSGGRFEWGVGAGWYLDEQRAYGYEQRTPGARVRVLREQVEAVLALWTQDEATYEGEFVRLDGARCDPKPVQSPHPPVWIGGDGERATLRVVARYADRANFVGDEARYTRKCDILHEHCRAVGRDPDEITKTWLAECFIRDSEAELAADWRGVWWDRPLERYRETNLVGTPDDVTEKVARYVELGCGGFVLWEYDVPTGESLGRFAEQVMPRFRTGGVDVA